MFAQIKEIEKKIESKINVIEEKLDKQIALQVKILEKLDMLKSDVMRSI